MTRRFQNLRGMILDALLAGEEICASTFAERINADPSSTARVLRDFSKYLDKRPAPNEPGKNRVYVRARDKDALLRIRHAKRLGTNQYTNPAPVTSVQFDDLLHIWGIAVKHLDLPKHVYCMMPPEDGSIFA